MVVVMSRYPYYVLGQLGRSPPYWLMWLRYSAFIVLYPIGIVSEVVARQPGRQSGTAHACMLMMVVLVVGQILLYVACLSDIRTAVAERDLYSIRMPNRFNFAFDAYYFVSQPAHGLLPPVARQTTERASGGV